MKSLEISTNYGRTGAVVVLTITTHVIKKIIKEDTHEAFVQSLQTELKRLVHQKDLDNPSYASVYNRDQKIDVYLNGILITFEDEDIVQYTTSQYIEQLMWYISNNIDPNYNMRQLDHNKTQDLNIGV